MAVLKKAIFGVANGEIYPRKIAAGQECPVELEDAAIEMGALTKKQRSTDPAAAQAEADAAAAAQVKTDAA